MVLQIAGIVAHDGKPPDRRWLEEMLDRLNPNGLPNARRIAGSGPAVFGAIATSPRGVDPGPAPRLVAEADTLFAADAVLYVRDRLPAGPDDIARMAAALRDRGPTAAADFEGDFAFAWWDGRTLMLARDHFGVRPLMRVHQPGRWSAFASHPAALLRTGLASRALNASAVLNFPHLMAPQLGQSLYRDLASVEPGRLHRLGNDGRPPAIERYWRLPVDRRVPWSSDREELSAEVRRLMLQAVERRLPKNGPVAAHMSGGIDSTPLVAAAARAISPQGRTVHAFALMETGEDFDGLIIDEADYVRAAAEIEPNIELMPVADLDVFSEAFEGYDLDTFLPLSPRSPERWILREAAARGATRLFSGWGGDQLSSFGGLGTAIELLKAGRLIRLARYFRHRAPGMSLKGAIYRQIVKAPLSQEQRNRLDRLVLRQKPREPRSLRYIAEDRREEIVRPVSLPDETDSRVIRRDAIEFLYPSYRFETFAQMGAEQGIAYVYPLMDLDLARFVNTMPGWFFIREGLSRSLHRDAIRGLVPESVRLRTAKYMPHPLGSIRMARAARAAVPRLEALKTGSAARYLAMDRLIEEVAALDAAEVEAKVRAEAERGEQYFLPCFYAIPAVQIAMALGQYDREFGDGAGEPAVPDRAAFG